MVEQLWYVYGIIGKGPKVPSNLLPITSREAHDLGLLDRKMKRLKESMNQKIGKIIHATAASKNIVAMQNALYKERAEFDKAFKKKGSILGKILKSRNPLLVRIPASLSLKPGDIIKQSKIAKYLPKEPGRRIAMVAR